jgi:acyl carrier protein
MRPDLVHIEQQLTDFITETSLPPGAPLGREEPLLAEGILDSLGVLYVVAFIEDEFAILVPEASWTPEHFQDVRHLAALIVHLCADEVASVDVRN